MRPAGSGFALLIVLFILLIIIGAAFVNNRGYQGYYC
ncbi:MAG: YjcZ family sporulation protein [Psychrobacillus psychrodurans]